MWKLWDELIVINTYIEQIPCVNKKVLIVIKQHFLNRKLWVILKENNIILLILYNANFIDLLNIKIKQ